MNLIDWDHWRPTDFDLSTLARSIKGVVPVRPLIQAVTRIILKQYPWHDRQDVAPLFDSSKVLDIGENAEG